MSIHNPHDHFFRESFGRPEIVRSYLEEYLPVDLQAELNLDDLTLQDGSFIDEELREHQSDLLYRTTLRESGLPTYLYFLFEHKSTPELLIGLQLPALLYVAPETLLRPETLLLEKTAVNWPLFLLALFIGVLMLSMMDLLLAGITLLTARRVGFIGKAVAAAFPTLSHLSNQDLLGILVGLTLLFALVAAVTFRWCDYRAREQGMIDATTNY